MVKVHEDIPATMTESATTVPRTLSPTSTSASSSSRHYAPLHKQRQLKPHRHPLNSQLNLPSNAFAPVNPIHIHNLRNPSFQYFIHHHHCPFSPPQCAEMCGRGAANMNGEGVPPNGTPAKFYFGPGFEPQRVGFYNNTNPGPSAPNRNTEEHVVYFHVNPGVTINLTMGDGNVEVLRGGGYRGPIIGGMVASQGVVETAPTSSSSTQSQQQHHHHHHHHHLHHNNNNNNSSNNNNNADMYCTPMHTSFGGGEFYPAEHYHYIPGTHPEMCSHHMHIHQGEYGPVTVPMVSTNSSPPIAMPVQVPPGHVVQQIVDESGTLRHLILSHHPPGVLPLPSQNPQHFGNGGPGNGTNHTQHPYYPPGNVAGYPPQPFHTIQTPHTVPSPTHLGHSPPPNPAYYKDERAQKQHIKLKKKLQEKHQKGPELSPRKDLVNGLKRSTTGATKDKGMNSVGTSEDGEESSVPDEEDSVQVVTDLLSSVQPPTVLDLTSRSALLQWAAPLRLSESASNDSGTNEIDISETDLRYEVLLSDKSREMKFKSIYNGPAHSCRIQDLKPGQEYSVSLQVHLDELQGYATDPIKFVTPACEPDQPLPPKLGSRSKNSLLLRWSASNDNGSRILFYILEYDCGNGSDFQEVHKTRNRTQYNLQKLQPATAYKFRLAVVNECGKSEYSESVSYRTTEIPPAQPDPPTLAEATVSSLHLKWIQRPKDEEFTLQMNDPYTQYGHITVYNGRETSCIINDRKRYCNYSFRLKVSNEGGISPWSDEVEYRTKPDRPGRPSKPLVKGRISAYSFKLSWDPPTETGGPEISRYILEVNSGSGYEQIYCGSNTEAVCDRLTPGTTYQLRVSCATSAGQSCPSDPCTVTTEAIAPGQCDPPKLIGKAKPDSISIRWSEPDNNGGAPILDYEVMMNPDSSNLMIYKNKETECTVTKDIIPGTEYEFIVRAVNRISAGPWSDVLKVTSGAAPPGPPGDIRLICKSPFLINVSWSEAVSNGSPIIDYRLEMSLDTGDDSSQFSNIYQGPLNMCDAKNLYPSQTYFFRVQALNTAGVGPHSTIASATTPAAPPSTVLIQRSEATPTTITLWWSEPSTNGAPILNYNIDIGEKIIQTDGPVNEFKLDNLHPNTPYKIKIQAVNAVGCGAYSSTWKAFTLKLPPTPPVLHCIGTGHNYLKLKWGEGKNLDFTQFTVEMENLRTKDWQCVFKGTALTCKVNKLCELTTYSFRINASNDAGIGDFSKEYQFATTIAPPAIIKQVKIIETDSRSCTVEWLAPKNIFTDPVIFQVQLAKSKEQVYKQIQRVSNTKCTIDNLEPGTDYCVRICPVRLSATINSGELNGPYSIPINFTTVTTSLATPATMVKPSSHSGSSTPTHSTKNRQLSAFWKGVSFKRFYQKNYGYFLALLFTIFAIFISLIIGSRVQF